MRLGIDIGGTKTSVAAVDAAHRVVARAEAPSGHGPRCVVDVAVALARGVMADPAVDIDAIGACMPGLVDPGSGGVSHAVNLGVEELDLAGALRAELGLPVHVDNDVKAAALGAAVHLGVAAARPGTAASAGTLAYLNVGTGLAAAMIRDGVVQRGPGGALGEIGHLPVGGSVPCRCGQIGCLETLASGSAVARVWTPGPGEDRDPFVSQDPAAREAARMLCDGVVTALQLLVLACGPDRVAIGGGVAAASGLRDGVLAAIDARARASHFVASLGLAELVEVLPSSLPVASLGAALLVPGR